MRLNERQEFDESFEKYLPFKVVEDKPTVMRLEFIIPPDLTPDWWLNYSESVHLTHEQQGISCRHCGAQYAAVFEPNRVTIAPAERDQEPKTIELKVRLENLPANCPACGKDFWTTKPITYKANLTVNKNDTVPINRYRSKRFMATVKSSVGITFSNTMSGMQPAHLPGNSTGIIYSTIAKMVSYFAEKRKPDAFKFVPAHEGLKRPYNILCMRAEKNFGYVYMTPDRTNNDTFILFSPAAAQKLKLYLAQNKPEMLQ
jgi:hypothetical protein